MHMRIQRTIMGLPGILLSVLLGLALSCQSGAGPAEREPDRYPDKEAPRIISLSGLLTEILFELGQGDHIVGRDVTSVYPAEVLALPNLGHVSQLNAEAILQLKPTLILVEQSQVQQAEALHILRRAGLEVLEVPTSHSLFNAVQAARRIGQRLPVEAEDIRRLEQKIERDSLALLETLRQKEGTPRVLFIYARGAGRMLVGGKGTSAEAIIEKAGGQNAIRGFAGFRALTPESLLEAAPDVILMFSSGLESLDGVEGLAQIPGIEQTPAFQQGRIVAMDGHLLTAFGPRAGLAAKTLARQMHDYGLIQ